MSPAVLKSITLHMHFYRVELITEREGHHGFAFYLVRKDADARASLFRREWRAAKPTATVERLELELTPPAVVAMLERIASHHKNGGA